MFLTSLNRIRLYCAGKGVAPITNSLQNNRLLTQWISSVSAGVEDWLNRYCLIQAYTEYYDMKYQMTEYFMRARPIVSVTDVYTEPSGIWDGRETPLSDCFIGKDDNSICFPIGMPWISKKGVRFRYVGGLAYHAVNSVFTFASAPGTAFTVGRWVRGGTSAAVGWVNAYDATAKTITIENYYGIFQAGETLSEYITEDGAIATTSVVLATISQQSLAESHPAIVMAVDAQVRYMWTYGTDFEKSSVSRDSVSVKVGRTIPNCPFIDEVYNLLQPYRVIEI